MTEPSVDDSSFLIDIMVPSRQKSKEDKSLLTQWNLNTGQTIDGHITALFPVVLPAGIFTGTKGEPLISLEQSGFHQNCIEELLGLSLLGSQMVKFVTKGSDKYRLKCLQLMKANEWLKV